ncbi:MAG: hypothetical protein IBX61_00085 [Thermoleophilia bacterium]|nr:hypothetical protein [Thermoleophilia bacterium]
MAAVSSTAIEPGETADLTVSSHMGRGMGGPHLFEVIVNSNDPAPSWNKVAIRVNYLE